MYKTGTSGISFSYNAKSEFLTFSFAHPRSAGGGSMYRKREVSSSVLWSIPCVIQKCRPMSCPHAISGDRALCKEQEHGGEPMPTQSSHAQLLSTGVLGGKRNRCASASTEGCYLLRWHPLNPLALLGPSARSSTKWRMNTSFHLRAERSVWRSHFKAVQPATVRGVSR